MGCPDSKGHSGAGGHPGITCKQLCEFLYDFVEGELPADRRESFEAHVKMCPPCEQYLKQYEHTIRMTKRCMCPGVEKPPPVPDDMIKAIMTAMKLPGQ